MVGIDGGVAAGLCMPGAWVGRVVPQRFIPIVVVISPIGSIFGCMAL
jgi:hypothetical protein